MVPRIWDLPREIRVRLSDHSGRQRAVARDGHLVLVLHEAPDGKSRRRESCYFWRNPDGEWCYSKQGHGLSPMKEMVATYRAVAERLEKRYEESDCVDTLFGVLESAAPLLRAARNFREALTDAIHLCDDHAIYEELQPFQDQMSDVARTAELVQTDVRHSIDYLVARETRLQSAVSQHQAMAAHRLNVLAAIFLPLGTIAAAFGMNMHHGLEQYPTWVFWFVMILGAAVGIGISGFLLGFRAGNLEQLLDVNVERRT